MGQINKSQKAMAKAEIKFFAAGQAEILNRK
jgi:hypothetical protein